MYRFSFTNSVFGKAQEVNRQLFHEIIARQDIKDRCKKIADLVASRKNGGEVDKLISQTKRGLPAFCWHAWFDDGKRKNYHAHPSGLIMIDVDHVEQPQQKYEAIAEKAKQLGLLVAHITPSTQGLRLVFPIPSGMDIIKAQSYYAHQLKLQVDACTKDLARLSFAVPEEYFLYVNEDGLFNTPPSLPEGEEYKAAESADNEDGRGVIHNVPNGENGNQDEALDDRNGMNSAPTLNSHPSTLNEEESSIATSSPSGRLGGVSDGVFITYEDNYDGIPYSTLVESLCELLGGEPAHGSRNNFIFSMAAYLRYVCNDDPNWIKQILPTYGETTDKWGRTIESACQRAQHKDMPNVVKRAIDRARHQVAMQNLTEDAEQNSLPPAMPEKLPKLIRLLTKNVPEVCRPAVANAVFPSLAAHLHGVKFWLKDGTEKEATFMCVTMAGQSSGKSSINKPIEYITADIVERDEINRKREQEWKDSTQTKGANKEKPKRPDDLCVQVLVSDMTNAAFVQRMKDAGDHYLYTNLEELELLKQLQTNGSKDVGKIICLCFDNGKYGQERVGTSSVTARVDIRWNWNASSTIQKGIKFFKDRMVDGTLSRINFCTIIRDKTKPFVYGRYDDKFAEDLKPFIANLNLANGHIECKQALELAKKMSEECEENAALADDDIYQELAYRAVTIAYLKSMVLYIANDMRWCKEIADFTKWSLQYDMWCKMHFFGDQLNQEAAKEIVKRRGGKKNMMDLLPDPFTIDQVKDVRRSQNMDEAGTSQMLINWRDRGYIEYDENLNVYFKSSDYLAKHAA